MFGQLMLAFCGTDLGRGRFINIAFCSVHENTVVGSAYRLLRQGGGSAVGHKLNNQASQRPHRGLIIQQAVTLQGR